MTYESIVNVDSDMVSTLYRADGVLIAKRLKLKKEAVAQPILDYVFKEYPRAEVVKVFKELNVPKKKYIFYLKKEDATTIQLTLEWQ